VMPFGDFGHIVVVKFLSLRRFELYALTVIDEVFDWQFGRESRNAADVIGVEVSDDQVIDLFHAGVLGRFGDPIGIPSIESRPAGIDENGLAGRRDEQGRLSSFHVNKISSQIIRSGGSREAEPGAEQRGKRESNFHGHESYHARNRAKITIIMFRPPLRACAAFAICAQRPVAVTEEQP